MPIILAFVVGPDACPRFGQFLKSCAKSPQIKHPVYPGLVVGLLLDFPFPEVWRVKAVEGDGEPFLDLPW